MAEKAHPSSSSRKNYQKRKQQLKKSVGKDKVADPKKQLIEEPTRVPEEMDKSPHEPEEVVDDQFEEGFELFKPSASDYLQDTWGDISHQRFKKIAQIDKKHSVGKNVEDRLRTKDKKTPKKKKEKEKLKIELEVEEHLNPIAKDDSSTDLAFHEMNLSRPILKALADLNFTNPTAVQAAAIPIGLLGKDICACSRTGTGKTAAYMLPIIERLHYKPKSDVATRVLVLVPTRELGAQVYSVTKELLKYLPEHIQVALAVGGLDMKKQEKELRERPDIVIATPGRLLDHIQSTPSFGLDQVEVLVLDEADRMLDEFFAEQMGEIIKMCSITRQTMLFSATLTDEVQKLASISLKDPVRLMVDESASVALALRQEFVRVREEDTREALLLALLCRSFPERTLVFIPTKVQVHRIFVILKLMKIKAAELHGNLSQLQRLESLEEFKEGRVDILLATDVAARGLDIPFVKTVINLALPQTLEQYVHRVGRTARAGRVGRSVSLVGEGERKLLKVIVKNARLPVQNRIIPPEIVAAYGSRLKEMSEDIQQMFESEQEDKALARMTKDIQAAEELLKTKRIEPVIQKLPLPGFSSQGKSRKWKKPVLPKKKPKVKRQGPSTEDISLSKVQKGQAKKFKKDSRPQRTRACADVPKFGQTKNFKEKGKKNTKKAKHSSFALDLADTRKQKLKRLTKIGGGRPNDKKSKKIKMKNKGKK